MKEAGRLRRVWHYRAAPCSCTQRASERGGAGLWTAGVPPFWRTTGLNCSMLPTESGIRLAMKSKRTVALTAQQAAREFTAQIPNLQKTERVSPQAPAVLIQRAMKAKDRLRELA